MQIATIADVRHMRRSAFEHSISGERARSLCHEGTCPLLGIARRPRDSVAKIHATCLC